MQHFKAVFVGIVVVRVLALIGASGGENAPSETYPTAAEALPAAATVAEEPAIEPEEEPAELDTWLADEPDAEVADYGYEPAPYGRSDPSAVRGLSPLGFSNAGTPVVRHPPIVQRI
jgi:hypothetical protein